jgi:hypothetical protein
MLKKKGWRSSGIVRIAVCAAFTSTALAGIRYGQPSVSITPLTGGGGHAMGTLGGVRNSANTLERLACAVTRTEITNAAGVASRATVVSCNARDKNGVTAACASRDERHAVALDGASNDSLIEFHYDAAANCTTVWVYESSSLERKGA